jgi:hypothetical protein
MGLIVFSKGDTVFSKSNPSVRGYVIDTNPNDMNDYADSSSHMFAVVMHPKLNNVSLEYWHDMSEWRTVLVEKIISCKNVSGYNFFT